MLGIRVLIYFCIICLYYIVYILERDLFLQQKATANIAKEVIEIPSTPIDPKNEGKKVVISGQLSSKKPFRQDPLTGYIFDPPVISFDNYGEIYQYLDPDRGYKKINKSQLENLSKEDLAKQIFETAKQFQKGWSRYPVEAKGNTGLVFKKLLYKMNGRPVDPGRYRPSHSRMKSSMSTGGKKMRKIAEGQLGDFTIPSSLLFDLPFTDEFYLTEDNSKGLKPDIRNALYDPTSGKKPQIGQLKIKYETIPVGTEVTVLGQQKGKSLQPIPIYELDITNKGSETSLTEDLLFILSAIWEHDVSMSGVELGKISATELLANTKKKLVEKRVLLFFTCFIFCAIFAFFILIKTKKLDFIREGFCEKIHFSFIVMTILTGLLIAAIPFAMVQFRNHTVESGILYLGIPLAIWLAGAFAFKKADNKM
ncbi:MAG: hypothetical protein D6767_07375 [Candidatus Hydrogenedentota bacterium]|nr:MAG: hypothetical protein D6767_07375 [Candidatus Hydrogenedentota bacterium]